MTKKVRQIILIKDEFGAKEIAKIKKYRNYPALSLTLTKHADLEFLKLMPNLEVLELYTTTIENYGVLNKIGTLRELFLNNIRQHEDLSFISSLSQIEKLSLLNLRQLEKLPDLSRCKRLKKVFLWDCKKLKDIQALAAVPNLEQLDIVDTPQQPDDLEFLMRMDNIKYIDGQFGSNKANKRFEELLEQHGKMKQPED